MFNDSIIYKFEDFEIDEDEGKLFRNGVRIELEPILFKALLLLVKNAGVTVSKNRLGEEVWGYPVADNPISTCISKVRKKLDENNREKFIETITGKISGYKFILPVTEIAKANRTLVSAAPVEEVQTDVSSTDFGGNYSARYKTENVPVESNHQTFGSRRTFFAVLGMGAAFIFFRFGTSIWTCAGGACFEQTVFIILAGVFYGILTGIGVLLECAYKFDRYGWNAAKMIPSIIFVNVAAMWAALAAAAANLLEQNSGSAFWKGLIFLIIGAVVSCILASFVLPNAPVTAAKFPTQSAIAAFCKNVFIYFLPLYAVFGLLIFCFVFDSSEVFKSIAFPIAFAVIWIVFFLFSYLSTNYLSDNLLTEKDGEQYKYHGLFSVLLQFRMFFCFIIPLGGIFWYFFYVLMRNDLIK